MSDLKDKLAIVTAKLFTQRCCCLAEAAKFADSEPDVEAHYRGQALALKDAIRLIDEAVSSVGIK